MLRLTAETALSRVQADLSKVRSHQEGRKEREGDYKAMMDEEHRRMKEMVQVSGQLRLQLRDIEARLGKNSGDFFDAPAFDAPVETRDESESDDLFLA